MSKEEQEQKANLNRRQLLGTTAAVAAAGATGVGGALTLNGGVVSRAMAQEKGAQAFEVKPGELDEYYVFFSSGQTGEVRIAGAPSMRELMRIPVFNRCSATGWGQTNESRKILTEGLLPETIEFLKDQGGVYLNGDLHHPHPSQTDGTYDGRYLYANDKANTRVARIRLDVMKCDKIIQLPNQHTVHGLRVQKYPKTGYVFCNGEDRAPIPNDGKILDDSKQYHAIFTAVDGETMKVAWQVMIDGNLDNVDADYQGKYAFATCYNSEEGVNLEQMMSKDQDWIVIFNLKRIEEAVKKGDFKEMGGVPVVDGRHGSPYTRYVPVSNSPHGINTAPDGIHVVANGKLSPTVTVFDVRKFDDLFDDKIKPRDTVVAEPELGLGTVAHRLRRQGQRLHDAVHRQPGLQMEHRRRQRARSPAKRSIQSARSSMFITSPATTTPPWARPRRRTANGCFRSTSSRRTAILNVGPLKPENDQLIDISGDEMVLVHDGPSFAEPHDATIVHRSKINPVNIWDRADPFFADAVKQAKADGIDLLLDSEVIRDGNKVRVYMTSAAPAFGLESSPSSRVTR
jgi:nitrous-oxide reductase